MRRFCLINKPLVDIVAMNLKILVTSAGIIVIIMVGDSHSKNITVFIIIKQKKCILGRFRTASCIGCNLNVQETEDLNIFFHNLGRTKLLYLFI